MINTPAICAKCASVDLQRNGTRDGHARYRCTACGHQARLVPAAVARAARYAQVDRLLAERNSQRSIVRVTGVSRVTVARLAKKGGGLIWEECAIVVVDDNFNSGLVHRQVFAEGAGFAHEHAAALAQHAINRFDDAGLPFAFGAGPVLPARQDLCIGR